MDQYFGGVIWTNHALQRLVERGLKQTDALATFSRPQYTRKGVAKNSYVFYRDYGKDRIEVVATQNEERKWVILSVWSKPVYGKRQTRYVKFGILENAVERGLQLMFGRLRKKFSKKK